jgi:DNA primase
MDQVSQIREKIDIVAFISEFITLKKAGRNFKANCPFHTEKSASFVVSPERQIWHCFGCFPPGEKIKTPIGYHNIEEIDENHWVVSGKGNIRKVLAVMQHQYKGELVSVRQRKLGGQVRLTSDHSVFAIRGAPYMQKEYKSFSKRYNKYLKIRAIDDEKYQKLINRYFPIKEIPAGELQRGDLLLYPINRTIADVKLLELASYVSKSTNLGPAPKKIPLEVPVSDDLLKFIGYYIAEGSSHRAYIRFSLGNHEEDFATEIVALVKKIFGLEAKIYRRPTVKKTGLEITACHAKLANIFENLCGKGSANKHIPFVFQELPLAKQKIILEAIHRGDGTTFIANRSKNSHKSITTISRILSEQIVDMLLRLNLFPTMHVEKTKVDKLGVNHREANTVFWSEEAVQKYNLIYYQQDGTEYWLLPITKLTKESYEGPVYNFTVNQDHSYVATNFAVANCGKGGDVYTFLMEYERLEFPEALRTLAKRTGVELATRERNTGLATQKERLYQINSLTKEYYHYVLLKHPAGKRALEYLKNRGISQKIIETFMLGFSPTGNALTKYLLSKKKYAKEDLMAAGVVFQKGYDVVDFFRGRLMFPLIDHRDNVVGFAGRILDNNETTSKYINTRETIIYHKGEQFYGLNITKDAIRRSNQAIIVEGEFDVISCFENGIANVVGIKGTALTESQVNLLGRFASKITFCFDGDKAGQDAIKRSLAIVEKKGLTPTVIEIPGAKDPDEVLQKEPGLFKKAVREDIGIYDYLFDKTLAEVNIESVEGKKRFADLLLPVIATIKNEIIKEHYIKKVSTELDTSYESIGKELEKLQQPRLSQAQQQAQEKQKRSKEEILEEYLLALIVQNPTPKKAMEAAMQVLSEILPKDRAYHKIMDHLLSHFEKDSQFDGNTFGDNLPKELVPTYDTCFLVTLPTFIDEDHALVEVRKIATQLKRIYIQKKLKALALEIQQNENDGREDEAAALRKTYSTFASGMDSTD